ncbi:hypothetical protein BJ165DRAFT_1533243 [Panaeolus papilionaceus]|nr:hypothetical protein BJ165DRAFT_1533243 [Panaeolus papilionaceus]
MPTARLSESDAGDLSSSEGRRTRSRSKNPKNKATTPPAKPKAKAKPAAKPKGPSKPSSKASSKLSKDSKKNSSASNSEKRKRPNVPKPTDNESSEGEYSEPVNAKKRIKRAKATEDDDGEDENSISNANLKLLDAEGVSFWSNVAASSFFYPTLDDNYGDLDANEKQILDSLKNKKPKKANENSVDDDMGRHSSEEHDPENTDSEDEEDDEDDEESDDDGVKVKVGEKLDKSRSRRRRKKKTVEATETKKTPAKHFAERVRQYFRHLVVYDTTPFPGTSHFVRQKYAWNKIKSLASKKEYQVDKLFVAGWTKFSASPMKLEQGAKMYTKGRTTLFSTVVSGARERVICHFGLGNYKNREVELADLVWWLSSGSNFAFGRIDTINRTYDKADPFGHPVILEVIQHVWFPRSGRMRKNVTGEQIKDDNGIPPSMVFLACAAIAHAIRDYASGTPPSGSPPHFTEDIMNGLYEKFSRHWDTIESQVPGWAAKKIEAIFTQVSNQSIHLLAEYHLEKMDVDIDALKARMIVEE